MHVQERQAWFILGVTTATLLLAVALVTLLGFTPPALSAFGVLGLVGIAGLIGRRERRAGESVTDERDHEIERTAFTVSYSVFWLLFVAAAMGAFLLFGPNAVLRVPAVMAPGLVYLAAAVVYLVRALTTIVLYRRGSDGAAG